MVRGQRASMLPDLPACHCIYRTSVFWNARYHRYTLAGQWPIQITMRLCCQLLFSQNINLFFMFFLVFVINRILYPFILFRSFSLMQPLSSKRFSHETYIVWLPIQGYCPIHFRGYNAGNNLPKLVDKCSSNPKTNMSISAPVWPAL